MLTKEERTEYYRRRANKSFRRSAWMFMIATINAGPLGLLYDYCQDKPKIQQEAKESKLEQKFDDAEVCEDFCLIAREYLYKRPFFYTK